MSSDWKPFDKTHINFLNVGHYILEDDQTFPSFFSLYRCSHDQNDPKTIKEMYKCSKMDSNLITYLLFSLTGYNHTDVCDTKIVIYPVPISSKYVTAISFFTSFPRHPFSIVQIDLCYTIFPQDPDGYGWYFRYTMTGSEYTYFLIDFSLHRLVLVSLRNIRHRITDPDWSDLYTHISGWKHLDRILEIAFPDPPIYKRLIPHLPADPYNYILWAVFCGKWKIKSTTSCSISFDDMSYNSIEIKYDLESGIQIYFQDTVIIGFPDAKKAIQHHLETSSGSEEE